MADEIVVGISKAPADPAEKERWAHQWMRVQIAMWLPANCEVCGHDYQGVDDFLDREVCAFREGPDGKWDHSFACETCFVAAQLDSAKGS